MFLKIQLCSNSFWLTVLYTFMLSSHCPLWVPRPFARFCCIYFSLFHFPPQHALFSFLHFLKAQFPCLRFLSPHSQHTHTHTHTQNRDLFVGTKRLQQTCSYYRITWKKRVISTLLCPKSPQRNYPKTKQTSTSLKNKLNKEIILISLFS